MKQVGRDAIDCGSYRVRLQRSYENPIAPQNIPSWIPLLQFEESPDRFGRHLTFFVRPSCVAWFVSINLT